MNDFWILAQSETQYEAPNPQKITSDDQTGQATHPITIEPAPNGGGPEDTVVTKKPASSMFNWFFIAAMFVLLYMIVFRGPRKKQQQQRQMLGSLRKNDKVRTIGGIIGTIIDIKDDEITLKVDESNNTKIKVIASAVSKNLSQD